ncbi:MAG: hypothetical protein C5B59_06645 [Bacteroidetes bacterium]|nr:MAG: hypothetical protein C5B59_06645 [Bacteroidota bacterium]
MTVFTVLVAVIARKVKALYAEYRKLVTEAEAVEHKLVGEAKDKAEEVLVAAKAEEQRLLHEVEKVIFNAKADEKEIMSAVGAETRKLRDELINKIAQL